MLKIFEILHFINRLLALLSEMCTDFGQNTVWKAKNVFALFVYSNRSRGGEGAGAMGTGWISRAREKATWQIWSNEVALQRVQDAEFGE